MPLIEIAGIRHYYRMEGAEDAPVLMFSHSLGCDHSQWDAQAAQLQTHFRVLRYDTRGHGASDATRGDYTIELLARDALAIADGLGIERFAFCGLSLGGMIAQWLAAFAPDRLTHVVLANTSSRLSDPSLMENRRRTVLEQGMAAIADGVMQRFFTAASLSTNSPAVANIRRVLLATNPAGYAGCCGAVRDMNQTSILSSIRTPALIIAGDRDVSTPWEGPGDVLAREIPQTRVEHLPTAHLSNVERPRSFNAALLRFLLPAQADPLVSGFEKRRAVLGDAYVDRAIAATSDFTRAFQELITRYAWGSIWQRPGLDDRSRRLLALTATAALGRSEEFRMHVRTGLQHELEPCDLEEALLQVAVYAGIPAANTGFQIAAEEMRGQRAASE
ncbi:MAG TPA: 3-oxoadipate enol-lactonase [Bryobacteraceae bacterium]|nr:3-oxoadipate enol-lactonase [Bryobacteraceae bacterium]